MEITREPIKEYLRKGHKMIIIILLKKWIVKAFISNDYGILIVDVLLKTNLIVLALGDVSVSMNWLIFYGLVKIVMYWKLEVFGMIMYQILITYTRRLL